VLFTKSSKLKDGEQMMEDLNFEQALARLEIVVQAMENDETGLEASIALYKEGVALSNRCNDILGRFEAEVVVLQQEKAQNDNA
jgi:exodeoxyribonuclease VII small subunit